MVGAMHRTVLNVSAMPVLVVTMLLPAVVLRHVHPAMLMVAVHRAVDMRAVRVAILRLGGGAGDGDREGNSERCEQFHDGLPL